MQAKIDVLFVLSKRLRQPKEYAFIGLQVKKDLHSGDLQSVVAQATAEFLTWGLHSYGPYIQVWLAHYYDLHIVSA